jgi:hypothetical protein
LFQASQGLRGDWRVSIVPETNTSLPLMNPVNKLNLLFLVALCVLVVPLHGVAANLEPEDGTTNSPVAASHGLIGQLERFLRQKEIEMNQLDADAVVALMADWYRFPVQKLGDISGDVLVYRYGGWSEGCATAFKLSLLRRVIERDEAGAAMERFAGITLLYEPSSQAELLPFSAVSSDAKTMAAFLQAIATSPAFKELARAKPMGVMVESGGVR